MQIETYQVPDGQKRAGMFTFRIDGQESLFYSTQEVAITAKITALMEGPPKGAVRLKALSATAKPMLTEGGEPIEAFDPMSLPTAAERIAAFMSRGKLAK